MRIRDSENRNMCYGKTGVAQDPGLDQSLQPRKETEARTRSCLGKVLDGWTYLIHSFDLQQPTSPYNHFDSYEPNIP